MLVCQLIVKCILVSRVLIRLLKLATIGWIFVFSIQICQSQTEYGNKQLGVYTMFGNSLAILPRSSTLSNQIADQRMGFVSSGLYCFIQLKNDSIYESEGFLRFLRFDLGVSNRAGIFEPTAGNYARINSSGIDMTVLLPLSFKAANETYAYLAIGPVLSYRYSWHVTPSQTLPELDKFKAGFAIEMGFRLRSGSSLGYRTMVDFGDYSYRTGSIFFGFSPQPSKPDRRRTQQIRDSQ
jgi:hypothetical protein